MAPGGAAAVAARQRRDALGQRKSLPRPQLPRSPPGCTSATLHSSTFEANNASESELVETTDTSAAGTVEGGGVFCEDSTLELRNITLRANEAHSKAATQGTGGGVAARSCVGPLANVDFDANVANQAGGVL